ncbi:MAG: hypothetical protein HY906_19190 [Deltaproteobacteria bacterium]|nr:hypothetical protein [Deltaproteobacteria bacterium]
MRPTRLYPVTAAAILLVLAVVARSPSPAAPAPSASAKELATARTEAARAAFEAVKASVAVGRDPTEAIYTWSVRWLTAQLEAGAKAPAALEDHRQRMKELEAGVTAKFQAGTAAKPDTLAAAYYRAEAEVWAARKKLR